MGAGYDPGDAMGDRTADMQIAQQGPPEQELKKWKEQRKREMYGKIGEVSAEISRLDSEAKRETDPERKEEIRKQLFRLRQKLLRLKEEFDQIEPTQTV